MAIDFICDATLDFSDGDYLQSKCKAFKNKE
jgi:hypothetical protein